MEENNNPTVNPAENKEIVSPPQNPAPQNEKPKDRKLFKVFLIVCVVLGGIFLILSLFVAPYLIKKIDPISKLGAAHIKECSKECSSTSDSVCINKCLQSKGYTVRVTPAKISTAPTPTASPTPTLTPIPTLAKKITYAPKASPTPAAPAALIVNITLPKKNATDQTKVVTIRSHNTGETFTVSGSGYINVYKATDGVYTLSVNDVPDHKTVNTSCDSNCGPGGGFYQNDQWGNERTIGIESGKSRGVGFYWMDNSALPH